MTLPFSLIRKMSFAALLCASTLSPLAAAGDQSNAEAAIAMARGKIAAGDKVGTSRLAPELQEQARAALLEAQDLLNNHHKKEAQAAAMHAGELADRALVSGDNRRAQVEQTRRLDTQEATINAQQSAASANQRANSAEAMGNAANLRADAAVQEAAAAEARSRAAQANPPMAALPQTTTTVTQQETRTEPSRAIQPGPARKRAHKARHAPAHHAPAYQHKTTTVVTTSQR